MDSVEDLLGNFSRATANLSMSGNRTSTNHVTFRQINPYLFYLIAHRMETSLEEEKKH